MSGDCIISRPDRSTFEQRIFDLNQSIEALEWRRREILGHKETVITGDMPDEENIKFIGELETCKRQYAEYRAMRKKARLDLENIRRQIDHVRTQIEEKRDAISPIEQSGDLLYKDEMKLRAKIDQLTKYHRVKGFNNYKEETMVVKEIDKLTRNLDKLPIYLELKKAEKAFTDQQKELTRQLETHRREERTARHNGVQEDHRRKAMYRELNENRSKHSTLFVERRCLINDYEMSRQTYLKRISSETRSKSSLISSNIDWETESDEETQLELFYEQKKMCRTALRYLEKLGNQMIIYDDVCQKPSSTKLTYAQVARATTNSGSHESSMSPGTDCTIMNNIIDDTRKLKKKTSKGVKKPSHSITHTMDSMHMFTQLGISIPATYNDVEVTIQTVRAKQAEIDKWSANAQEMSHEDWYHLYAPQNRSNSVTESNFTMSDSCSLSSSVTSPTSSSTTDLTRPICRGRLPISISGTSLTHSNNTRLFYNGRASDGQKSKHSLFSEGRSPSQGENEIGNLAKHFKDAHMECNVPDIDAESTSKYTSVDIQRHSSGFDEQSWQPMDEDSEPIIINSNQPDHMQ